MGTFDLLTSRFGRDSGTSRISVYRKYVFKRPKTSWRFASEPDSHEDPGINRLSSGREAGLFAPHGTRYRIKSKLAAHQAVADGEMPVMKSLVVFAALVAHAIVASGQTWYVVC